MASLDCRYHVMTLSRVGLLAVPDDRHSNAIWHYHRDWHHKAKFIAIGITMPNCIKVP
jgi:hypothetical protein